MSDDTVPVRIEIDMSPALKNEFRKIRTLLREQHQEMEQIIVVTKDELTTQLTDLVAAQGQTNATLTELVKDQDRVLARLADLLASNDLTGAADLVAQVQAQNADQLAKLTEADAALEAADPEKPNV